MTAADRHRDAADVAHFGLTVIGALGARYPEAARSLRGCYVVACQKAGIGPDMALLDRVAHTLGASGAINEETSNQSR
jgi:hypothetical protein